MGIKEDTLKRINELRVPKDMKQMAWDWYIFGYKDGQDADHEKGDVQNE